MKAAGGMPPSWAPGWSMAASTAASAAARSIASRPPAVLGRAVIPASPHVCMSAPDLTHSAPLHLAWPS